jgi:hypothetical protein
MAVTASVSARSITLKHKGVRPGGKATGMTEWKFAALCVIVGISLAAGRVAAAIIKERKITRQFR